MKLLKKTLAILLCLIMAVCIMPLSASAKDFDVVKVDHVTVKTDSIFKVGEALPKNFKADYTDHLFKLEDADWSCTEVYNEGCFCRFFESEYKMTLTVNQLI